MTQVRLGESLRVKQRLVAIDQANKCFRDLSITFSLRLLRERQTTE